eukprot:snap_masked-scaffold_7-processed-gene-9.24-mRNA-1 protein AED:1.00 eAED:1.00 QI:0/0/0/0/1/1/2/0/442
MDCSQEIPCADNRSLTCYFFDGSEEGKDCNELGRWARILFSLECLNLFLAVMGFILSIKVGIRHYKRWSQTVQTSRNKPGCLSFLCFKLFKRKKPDALLLSVFFNLSSLLFLILLKCFEVSIYLTPDLFKESNLGGDIQLHEFHRNAIPILLCFLGVFSILSGFSISLVWISIAKNAKTMAVSTRGFLSKFKYFILLIEIIWFAGGLTSYIQSEEFRSFYFISIFFVSIFGLISYFIGYKALAIDFLQQSESKTKRKTSIWDVAFRKSKNDGTPEPVTNFAQLQMQNQETNKRSSRWSYQELKNKSYKSIQQNMFITTCLVSIALVSISAFGAAAFTMYSRGYIKYNHPGSAPKTTICTTMMTYSLLILFFAVSRFLHKSLKKEGSANITHLKHDSVFKKLSFLTNRTAGTPSWHYRSKKRSSFARETVPRRKTNEIRVESP